jgi:two-component system phosphate regulon sensor histidine kinase PhoR
MGSSRRWTIVVLGAAAAAVAAAIWMAFGDGPVLAVLASGAIGAGGAALIAYALCRNATRANAAQAGAPDTQAMHAMIGREMIADFPLALVLLDANGRIRLLNSAAAGLFGQIDAGERLSSMTRSPAHADAVSAAAAGGSPATVEFVHMRAREQRVLLAHVRRTEAPMPHQASGVMILIEDHTKSAKAEQVRRDFVANASHELKTPLASIAGFIETLRGPAANDPEARARFLPIMAEQAERMKRLIDDLMSLNRIELNEHVRPDEVCRLDAVLRDSVSALAPLLESAAVTVEVDLPDAGIAVTGDRAELTQLFTNLIDNAVRHGGSNRPVRVHMAKPEPGRAALIGVTVTDRGPGIAREHIPRLTERFYQVSDSRSRAKGGTGLGLSIVKHILGRHRGELSVRSSPGNGASFTAWLPRAANAAASEDS